MLNAFKSPFLMKAFYCAINGLASLMLMKVFLFFFDIVGHVQQWCIKRAKMKTTDDDGNYMFQFLRFFLTHPTRFDGFFIDEIKREIKLNNYTIYSWSSSVSGFRYGSHACVRPSKCFDYLESIFIHGCDVKLDQLNWVIKWSPFTIEMFGKVLLCRLARCIIESDDLVRVSIVFRAHSYQLNRANVIFFFSFAFHSLSRISLLFCLSSIEESIKRWQRRKNEVLAFCEYSAACSVCRWQIYALANPFFSLPFPIP